MATPKTPAPAISGPISTPSPESTIMTATTANEGREKVAQDRQQRPQTHVAGELRRIGYLDVRLL